MPNDTPTIPAGWLNPGAFASAVDFDSYWHPQALVDLDHLSTDDHAQFAYYRSLGYFADTPDPRSDPGELVRGAKPGRAAPTARKMALNLGLAIEDVVVAGEVRRRALERGIGMMLER